MTFTVAMWCDSPPEPGFARREARYGCGVAAAKKGAHGGNMVSPVSKKAVYELRYELDNRPDWVGIPVAGILRLIEAAATA